MTITNNFFKNNNKKIRLNYSANKRDRNIPLIKKEIKNKKIKDKTGIKIIPNNINKTNFNSPNIHSKNSSNLSTEFSHNNNSNKNSRKIKMTKLNESEKNIKLEIK